MNRVILSLAGLQVLSLVAIGWLWSGNQSLRTQVDHGGDRERAAGGNSVTQGGRPSVEGEVDGTSKVGTRSRIPGDPRPSQRLNGPLAETRGSAQPARHGPPPVGNIGSLEQRMPADDPSVPGTSLIVAKQPSAGSLIVNGGFDGGLAPWICDGGRVIRDPAEEKNWLLEVTPSEGRFRLMQFFKTPARKAPMTLSFRAMISEEATVSGFDLMLLGFDEKPLVQTIVTEGTPGEWMKIEWKGTPPAAPAALSIGRRGKGVVWIDDVRLEQSPAEPAQAQAP